MTTEEKKKREKKRGEKKKKTGKKEKKIMMKIVATNVVASRPPERQGSPATTIARAKIPLTGGGCLHCLNAEIVMFAIASQLNQERFMLQHIFF